VRREWITQLACLQLGVIEETIASMTDVQPVLATVNEPIDAPSRHLSGAAGASTGGCGTTSG